MERVAADTHQLRLLGDRFALGEISTDRPQGRATIEEWAEHARFVAKRLSASLARKKARDAKGERGPPPIED